MKFITKPSPTDVRDSIYKNDSTEVLREFVDLREWDSIIESQYQLGSCASNALTNAYELSVIREYPEYFTELSRLFIYYNTRAEYGNVLEDNGMFLRDGLKSLAKFGVCSEKLWPYNSSQVFTQPTVECYNDAEKRKIVKYQRILSIYYITQVLNNNKPVVFGMEIYENFMNLNERISTVTFPSRKEKSIGGHGMCMVGYDLKNKLFLAKNSFGSNWGAGGYCWIPFDYIRQEAYDIWTFDVPNQPGDLNVLSETLPILPLLQQRVLL